MHAGAETLGNETLASEQLEKTEKIKNKAKITNLKKYGTEYFQNN